MEWVKQMGTIKGGSKFKNFKTFLVGKKTILDALKSIGFRNVELCYCCTKTGHKESCCSRQDQDRFFRGWLSLQVVAMKNTRG